MSGMAGDEMSTHSELSRAGELFEKGKYKEAFEVYSRLGRTGNVYAQTRLADMYATGQGVAMDLTVARELYASAAEEDYLPAKYKYAWFIIDKEPHEAFIRMSYLAEAGYLPAIYWIGMMHYEGIGTNVNTSLGEHYLDEASARGHVWAERYLIARLFRTNLFGAVTALVRFIPLAVKAYRIHRENRYDDRLRS